jgi:ABC-type multidrug transport system ATPase subunit
MSLSGGERRRLEVARCLVSNPQLILLDEPFTGIDPKTVSSIQEIIRDLRELGIAILITDHQVRETLQITDRSYVVHSGKVLCHGTPREVIQNREAREHYFGEKMDITLPQNGPSDAAAWMVGATQRQDRATSEVPPPHHRTAAPAAGHDRSHSDEASARDTSR